MPEWQALSYSMDGVRFQFYEKNPVLDIGSTSFRDPQVFWHSPTNQWVMVLALPRKHQVSFYTSSDLKQWRHQSDFGPMGAHSSDWEVPDLFQMPIDGNTKKQKWVLTIGQGPNKMQYFLGSFDGSTFMPDSQTVAQNEKPAPALWADWGTDFYAARSWRNVDDTASGRTTWLGWMGNWSYAGRVPTSWGKGFESIPRDLRLQTFAEGVRLVQTPVPELKKLRQDSVVFSNKPVAGTMELPLFKPKQNVYEIEARMDLGKASAIGFNLLVGAGRKLVVGYDVLKKELFLDRSACTDYTTDSLFNKTFAVRMVAPLIVSETFLKLHILVDKASVEVFADGGKVTISATTFPAESQTGIELFAADGRATLLSFKGWTLASIWK